MRRARGERSSPSPTPTRPGSPTRCASSSRPFADPQVGYVCGQVRFVNEDGEPTRRASTGATRRGCAGWSRGSPRSPRATARSTRSAARPTSRSIRSWATTSRSRSTWSSAAGARSTRRGARAIEKMVPSIEGEFARKRRMMSHTWPIVLRGGLLDPRGYGPLYALMIVSHRVLRYATPFLHVIALASERGAGGAPAAARSTSPRWRPSSRCWRRRGCGRACGLAPLLVARYYVLTTALARRRAVGLAARGDRRRAGSRRRGRAEDPLARAVEARASTSLVSLAAARCSQRRCRAADRARDPRWSRRASRSTRQRRVGRDGAPFEIFKFRTMVSGAEFIGAGLAVQEGDDRITRVGALLRRTSLDELPNLRQRAPRGDVDRRPAARPCRCRSTTTPTRQRGRLEGQAGDHRLGADPRARRRCRGRSASSSTSTTSSTSRSRSTPASSPGRPRCCSAGAGSTRARAAAGT